MAEAPKVDALLLCDYVHLDPATAKYSLLGILDRLHAKRYPARFPTLGVYARLTNMKGEYQITVRLTRRGHDETSIEDGFGRRVIDDPLAILELDFARSNLLLPAPGAYDLQLIVNGDLLHRTTVRAIEVR